jgi:hypothetical protein
MQVRKSKEIRRFDPSNGWRSKEYHAFDNEG